MVFRSVVAAVDFSATSRAALAMAARLASTSGAVLHVVYAQDPTLITVARQAGINLEREVRDHLEAFVRSARPTARCRRHLHVVFGAAAPEICRLARRRNADVIVIGGHGLSDASHAGLGGTAEEVLRCANRPVLVLPDARVEHAEQRPPRRSASSRAPRAEAAEPASPHA
jgi:nucleotide-binding universal stress UspA family protein